MMKNITYLDLFSGAGGFALGLTEAGFRFENHYFSEIDPHAIALYQKQFPKAIPLGNIENIYAQDIKKPDLITFGFPCQDLSLSGKRAGLKGARSGLFFQALRLIKTCRPHAFIFENVKGLLSSQKGQDFRLVLESIAHTGLYHGQWQLLNTAWFLPQNRERVYYVGTAKKQSPPKYFLSLSLTAEIKKKIIARVRHKKKKKG